MTDSIMKWAEIGARTRVKELELEIAEIVTAFPALRSNGEVHAPARPEKRRRTMSAKARKAISNAQKKRWATQKATESKATKKAK